MNTMTRLSVRQPELEEQPLHSLAAAVQLLVCIRALCAIGSSPVIVSSTTKKPVARQVNSGECSTRRNNASKEPKQQRTFARAKARPAVTNRPDRQYVVVLLRHEHSNGFPPRHRNRTGDRSIKTSFKPFAMQNRRRTTRNQVRDERKCSPTLNGRSFRRSSR